MQSSSSSSKPKYVVNMKQILYKIFSGSQTFFFDAILQKRICSVNQTYTQKNITQKVTEMLLNVFTKFLSNI